VTGVAVGTSTITYTLTGGCNSTLGISVIACPTEIAGTNLRVSTFAVFPNPSQGKFSVIVPASPSETTLTISDIMGKSVKTTQIAASTLSSTQYISELPEGIYIVSMTNADGKQQIKVAVNN
jgi:hypothetical protein